MNDEGSSVVRSTYALGRRLQAEVRLNDDRWEILIRPEHAWVIRGVVFPDDDQAEAIADGRPDASPRPPLAVSEAGRYEELAHVGDIRLPKTGRIIRVRVMPDPEHGPGVDVREFVEPAYWDRINAARARAASSGRALRDPVHQEQYVGPMRKGWRLGSSAAEDLAELLALAVVKAEAITPD